MESTLTKRQTIEHGPKTFRKQGTTYRIKATVRYDDECGNGHNTFAITGETERKTKNGWAEDSCGCIHEEIAKHFPKLKPFIKWHLCSSDGPMHYIANTIYAAGNRDHNGLKEDERRQIKNGRTGKLSWILETPNCPKYVDSDEKPTDPPAARYVRWYQMGEGKAHQFDAARSTAVWPEATDEVLSQDRDTLKSLLEARLPALLEAFRKDVESLGLIW